MILKEIKPGMVIHCKTLEEMEQAIEHYKIDEDASLIWNYKSSLDDERRDCLQFNESGNYTGFCSREYFEGEGYTITEFSDLILPDLTAEEVLEICHKICGEAKGHCASCRLKKCCYRDKNIDYSETLDILKQWKSYHEKKEPEIETVDICRIIEIQPNGAKLYVHEETIKKPITVEETLKRYCMEHEGEFIAVHNVVSRVRRYRP